MMTDSVLLSESHWPLRRRPENVFQHFLDTLCSGQKPQYFKTRHDLINALTLNKEFRMFFEETPVARLDGVTHLHRLLYSGNLDEQGLVFDYMRFRQWKEFEDLPEEKRLKIESEFSDIRKEAYQAVLIGEAQRKGCEIDEVCSLVQVLPLRSNECPSKLMELPEEVFVRVLALLETWDVFQFALVCKKWRNLVYANRSELRRAEFGITTHLLTFTQWTKPFWNTSTDQFISNYLSFRWGLIEWYCSISENLETLILEGQVEILEVAKLLEWCPNLTYLQIGNSAEDSSTSLKSALVALSGRLPRLKTLIASNDVSGPYGELLSALLIGAKDLAVYRGPASPFLGDSPCLASWTGHIFARLTALDLTHYSFSLIQILSDMENLQLRYLRLSNDSESSEVPTSSPKVGKSFQQLLRKLKKLEVLILLSEPGLNDETLRLLTTPKLNLQFAVLQECTPVEQELNIRNNERVRIQARVKFSSLVNFQQMLLDNNPGLDLADFYFILRDKEHLGVLRKAKTGFCLLEEASEGHKIKRRFGLSDPVMQRRLKLLS